MSEVLLVEIDFNSKTWYLSGEGYLGDNYYAPYLSKSPSLELGQVKGGYIGVRIGNISIASQPNNKTSPFSIFGGGYSALISNPTQKIPIRIYWRQEDTTSSIFNGLMYLKDFNVDNFNFLLEDQYDDVDLLKTVSDITSELIELSSISIRGLGTTAEVTSPDHGLSNGDLINVSGSPSPNTAFNTPVGSTSGDKRPITVVDDNSFRYTIDSSNTAYQPSGPYKISYYEKKNVPFSFGIVTREKGLIQVDDGTGDYSGFAYANPDLDISANTNSSAIPIQLFDDGVLTGTNDLAFQGGLHVDSTIQSVTYANDIVTITTTSSNNITIGSAIRVQGLLPAELNTNVVIVSDTNPSSNSVSYYNNSRSETGASLDSSVTSKVTHFSNYYGALRLPTASVIKSRATYPDLTGSATKTNASGQAVSGNEGAVLLGQALISGKSTNGSTIADFFSYVAEKLGISSVDFSLAPNASSLEIELWETSQTKLVDFAGELALSANYLFELKNDVLKIVDRSFERPDHISIDNSDIIKTNYVMPNPVKAIRSVWETNVVNTITIPASLTQRDESVMISNSSSGEIRDIRYVTKNTENQRNVLISIRDVINKVIIKINVGGIRSDLSVGSRIKFNRSEDGLSVDMSVRTISYNFSDLETEIVGDGTLKIIEQDSIY